MRWWQWWLPPRLEADYRRESEPGRVNQLRAWCLVTLGFFSVTLILDRFGLPDVFWLSVWLHAGVFAPMALVARHLLRPSSAAWLKSAAALAVPLGATLLQMMIFSASSVFPRDVPDIVLFVDVLWVNVLIPFRVAETAAFSAVALVGGNAINFCGAMLHHGTQTDIKLRLFLAGVALMSVLSRALSERASRFAFQRGLALRLQAHDLLHANARLLQLSQTDPLTGLFNRRHFDRALHDAWDIFVSRSGHIALLMVDVDHFKAFNDSAGHQEGDRCLVGIARAIANQVRRDADIAARFGGEEFVVMMPGATYQVAMEVAQRVHAAIAAQRVLHPAGAGGGYVSVSIGIAAFGPDDTGSTPDTLIGDADAALYEAKKSGRNRIVAAA